MFGFLFGTLCLIAFVSVLRRRRWRRFGEYGWHGYGAGGCSWRHRRGAGVMYRAFEALDTSPGQEKAIRGALSELRETFFELRPEMEAARSQLAQSVAAESFDAVGLETAVDGQLSSLRRIGPVLSRALGQIHEALDPDQRRRLARLLERGRGYGVI